MIILKNCIAYTHKLVNRILPIWFIFTLIFHIPITYAHCKAWHPHHCFASQPKVVEDPGNSDNQEAPAGTNSHNDESPLIVRGDYAVLLKNACDTRIQAAIRYKNISGEWTTAAWWILEEGESVLAARTKNSIYYTYAESISSTSLMRVYWRANPGEENWQTIRNSENKYPFEKHRIEESPRDYYHEFQCQ